MQFQISNVLNLLKLNQLNWRIGVSWEQRHIYLYHSVSKYTEIIHLFTMCVVFQFFLYQLKLHYNFVYMNSIRANINTLEIHVHTDLRLPYLYKDQLLQSKCRNTLIYIHQIHLCLQHLTPASYSLFGIIEVINYAMATVQDSPVVCTWKFTHPSLPAN